MKKQLLIACALCAGFFADVSAVPTNYALKIASGVTVDCGVMPRLDGATSYTIQFWMCPDTWTADATLLSVGDAVKVKLGSEEGSVVFTVNGTDTKVSSTDLKAGQWSQLTYIVDEGSVKGYVNGKRRSQGTVTALPAETGEFVIGGTYSGRLDEVRLWNAALSTDFDLFAFNTVNRWNPQVDNLVAYYKFDQTACPNAIIDYTALWESAAGQRSYTNNGQLGTGAEKVAVTDNASLPYLVNGAYTANERFFDRAVTADQYLMSNDLIILGIQSYSDGHLKAVNPNNHGTLSGGASYLASYEGRSGVLALDGTGKMTAPSTTLTPVIASSGVTVMGYTVEGWVYIDKWVEGAYIFRKETADGSQGLSLRLGTEENHQLIVRCNGKDYVQQKRGTNDPELLPGQWAHIAIAPGLASAARNTFAFYVDDKTGGANASLSTSEIDYTPTGTDDVEFTLGDGFVGKMDEFAIWGRTLDLTTVKEHAEEMLMPAIGKSVSSEYMMTANAFWKFDKQDNPGYSSMSQDEWKAIMEEAYKGCDGYEIRISVKSHTGWETTISSAAKRKIFAQDLAKLAEGYDGVELDLEWIYSTQTNLGLLAQEIRNYLPEGKSLMISCHNVAYRFPTDKMQYCEGFTFQQYGPQKDHSYLSHFKSMCQTFVNYGFPKSKIIGSYATTTSEGYLNGSRAVPIKGVRDGFMDGDFDPQDEVDAVTLDGYTYYFDGPRQTYLRARYIMEQQLGGIFYWDMGNDTPVEHKYNLAKWCSYGLNSNVEPRVTDPQFNHYTGIREIEADAQRHQQLAVSDNGGKLTLSLGQGSTIARVSLSGLSGRQMLAAEGNVLDCTALPSGVYLLTATTQNGSRHAVKYLKK